MKSVFALGLIGLASAFPWSKEFNNDDLTKQGDLKPVFEAWTNAFHKEYENAALKDVKYAVWQHNVRRIADMNSNEELTFKLRLNQFADMTDEEFQESHKCYVPKEAKRISLFESESSSSEEEEEEDVELPSSVDWSQEGKVTPVKDQGQCGSCWAFSATGDMECEYAIAHNTLRSLSEQQLVDCATRAYGNYGCNGGNYDGAWDYAKQEGGLCLESNYRYTAKDGTCKDSSCGTKYNDPSGYSQVTRDSDTALATAAAAGCVSVAIEADQFAFQYYSSGVLTGSCGTRTDHAVLVVGYGTESGQEYWKVKNSWGTSWGENGYVLICRNCDKNGNKGECGINTDPMQVHE